MLRIASIALIAATIASPAPKRPPESVDSPRWSSDDDTHFRKFSKHFFGPFFDWRWFKAQAIVESKLDPRGMSPPVRVGVMQPSASTFLLTARSNPQLAAIPDC